MNQDLRISLYPLIELLVCHRSVINCDLVRNDEAWLCSSSNNEISQMSVVSLDIALTST